MSDVANEIKKKNVIINKTARHKDRSYRNAFYTRCQRSHINPGLRRDYNKGYGKNNPYRVVSRAVSVAHTGRRLIFLKLFYIAYLNKRLTANRIVVETRRPTMYGIVFGRHRTGWDRVYGHIRGLAIGDSVSFIQRTNVVLSSLGYHSR